MRARLHLVHRGEFAQLAQHGIDAIGLLPVDPQRSPGRQRRGGGGDAGPRLGPRPRQEHHRRIGAALGARGGGGQHPEPLPRHRVVQRPEPLHHQRARRVERRNIARPRPDQQQLSRGRVDQFKP